MIRRQQDFKWDDTVKVRRMPGTARKQRHRWWDGWPVKILALGLFLGSGTLLRLWDATAGVLDIGILSVLPLAMLVVFLARLAAAGVYKQMVESINQLTVWQQTGCYGCLYLCYFWAVV